MTYSPEPRDRNLTRGSMLSRDLATIAFVRVAVASGAALDDLAAAFNVSDRTIRRWADPGTRYATVELDGWRAVYAYQAGRPPRRVSGWTR